MVRLIVAGSRSITDYPWVRDHLDRITANISVDEVVSGGARGVDTLGEQWASDRMLTVTRFTAKWETHGRRAGYLRNAQMADYATHLVAFWDGESRGTQHMIDLAREQGLTVRVIRTERRSS